MNNNIQATPVERLLAQAKRDVHKDYKVYNEYRNEVAALNLNPDEYTKVIIKLAKILEV